MDALLGLAASVTMVIDALKRVIDPIPDERLSIHTKSLLYVLTSIVLGIILVAIFPMSVAEAFPDLVASVPAALSVAIGGTLVGLGSKAIYFALEFVKAGREGLYGVATWLRALAIKIAEESLSAQSVEKTIDEPRHRH